MIRRRDMDDPYQRFGHCCGKRCPLRGADGLLFRVAPMRYRCRVCFKREARFFP